MPDTHHNDPALIAATATIVAALIHQDLDTRPLPRLIAEVKRDLLADPAVALADSDPYEAGEVGDDRAG